LNKILNSHAEGDKKKSLKKCEVMKVGRTVRDSFIHGYVAMAT